MNRRENKQGVSTDTLDFEIDSDPQRWVEEHSPFVEAGVFEFSEKSK
jgi:hypothetical protein